MKVERTERGFAIIKFTDERNATCTLQKSSQMEPECVWLGVENVDPKILVSDFRNGQTCGKWIPVPFPEGTLFHSRMHLTQEQVKELLPLLQKFADSGELE